MAVSKSLIRAVNESPLPEYRIAQLAGLHPSTVSKLLNGLARVRPGDHRALAIARVLGLSEQEAIGPDSEIPRERGTAT